MKKRIVIADDDPIIRNLVELMLSPDDFDVVSAADGKNALALIGRIEPAAAILDIRMPEFDGLQVLARLKSDPRTKAMPVMMLTGERDAEAVTRALEAGAGDYLVKPFKPDELSRRIARLIKRNEMVWAPKAQDPAWVI